MLVYPVTLVRYADGSSEVRVPDLPEANSAGDDSDEALLNAVDAIETALDIYFDERRPVPLPSRARKEQPTVALTALKEAKILLWNEMQAQELDKAELARSLNVPLRQVDRLFNLKYPSKFEFIELAAKALGKTFEISLV
jgi:antitoxin HicB